MDKILLIDGHNAIHRANTSFGPDAKKHTICCLSQEDCKHNIYNVHCMCGSPWDTDNEYCQEDFIVIYNFFRNLRPLIEDFAPDKCFFVLEGHPQFRYDLFSDYKGNRIVKEASKQATKKVKFNRDKNIILPLMQYLPITLCKAGQYEADDVISTLCFNMKDEDITVLSNDSDYIQLLQLGYHNIQIYDPIKKQNMSAPEYPYVAWKSLNGDKSDNIPALLSKKKALDTVSDPVLFQKFMSLEENRANFSINRQLIEFRSVPEDEIHLTEGLKDFISLKSAFEVMKFESIINDKSWNKFCKTFDCIKY